MLERHVLKRGAALPLYGFTPENAAPQPPASHLYDHVAGADVDVRQLVEGDFGFVDAANLRMRGRQELIGEATPREGRVMWDLNGMRSEDWDHAAADSTRRQFLAQAAAAAAAQPLLLIDTHLEVWTFDAKFPFHHPLWREVERLGVVFNFYILPQRMPMLEEMAGRFPGVKIVIDHLGKPDLRAADPWPEFKKMFRLKRFPQVWVSASEPYELSLTKEFPYRDTYPFFKATYEEFGGKQLIWGTGYPKPRWELPMDQELEFVNSRLDFYTAAERELILGKNALRIWRFPEG